MSAAPVSAGDTSAVYGQPRLFAYFNNNVFMPTWDISIEQTVYGHSDTANIVTFLDGSPDYDAQARQLKYVPMIIKAGEANNNALPTTLFNGLLDEIDNSYDEDTITMSCRGILALLADQRTTERADMNVDVGTVITKLITSQGLKAQVATAGVTVGKVLNSDFASMGKNCKILDYINSLAAAIGWQTRVQGTTVIVGPPPDNVPTFNKQWGNQAGEKLSIKHSALHAHNIRVRVVSYNPKTKGRVNRAKGSPSAHDLLLLNGNTLNPPAGAPPSKAKGSGPVTYTGTANPSTGEDNIEEYVFNIPGLDDAQADVYAANLQAEISRHEFIMELTFAPTYDEMVMLASASPEFLINLTGCSQKSHNQLYHPRRITWEWSLEKGLSVCVLAVNHVVPQDTDGSTPNSPTGATGL